jgi:hypothetical protein
VLLQLSQKTRDLSEPTQSQKKFQVHRKKTYPHRVLLHALTSQTNYGRGAVILLLESFLSWVIPSKTGIWNGYTGYWLGLVRYKKSIASCPITINSGGSFLLTQQLSVPPLRPSFFLFYYQTTKDSTDSTKPLTPEPFSSSPRTSPRTFLSHLPPSSVECC